MDTVKKPPIIIVSEQAKNERFYLKIKKNVPKTPYQTSHKKEALVKAPLFYQNSDIN